MTKEVYKQKCFCPVITENLNWEVLTRIQLLLKDDMALKMENFNIMQVQWKIQFLGGSGGLKKTIYRVELPKIGGLGQFADLREGV